MPDENQKEGENFTVVDRRRFTPEGDRRSNVETPPPPEPTPPPRVPPPSTAPGADTEGARAAQQAYEQQRSRRERKLDFETLVLSLSTSAMYQLGLVEDPTHGTLPADLEAARHTIDMLGVIQDKTRGSLTAKEQRLLDQVLYELRLSYVAITSGKKPGAPQAGE